MGRDFRCIACVLREVLRGGHSVFNLGGQRGVDVLRGTSHVLGGGGGLGGFVGCISGQPGESLATLGSSLMAEIRCSSLFIILVRLQC